MSSSISLPLFTIWPVSIVASNSPQLLSERIIAAINRTKVKVKVKGFVFRQVPRQNLDQTRGHNIT